MQKAIVNGHVLTPDGFRDDITVLLERGMIASFTQQKAPSHYARIDASGMIVCPGLVDLHVHGGGGYDFMDGTAAAFIGAAQAHLLGGVTTMLPTTLCGSYDETVRVFRAYSEAILSKQPMPNLHGIHMEGPFLAPEQAGAQDPAHLLLPRDEFLAGWLDSMEHVVMMTAAPELPGGLALGDALRNRGIVASIGHSDATYAEVSEAFVHGYSHITHLYSGMSTFHRDRAMRVLGVVESAYLLAEATVDIIADGIHLPPELLRLIVQCKDTASLCLITDALRGAGLPDGTRIRIGSVENGREAILENGVAYMPDYSCFAGSVATGIRCVRTMVDKAGLPLETAIAMMTVNPCHVLGIGGRKGCLVPGYDADFLLLDEHLRVRSVYVAGECRVREGRLLA